MKKLLFIFILVIVHTTLLAQNNEEKESSNEGWTKAGKISLLFNQAAFNHEWTGGGTSNIAGNFSVSFDLNYKKGKISWDNKLLADYGLTKLKGDEFTRKTNDRFEINSLVGKQLKDSHWFISAFLNFKTQMDSGYEDRKIPVLDNAGQPIVINGVTLMETTQVKKTHFFSPAYVQAGPGLLWKKSDHLKINIAPITSKFVFVHDEFTDVGSDLGLIDAFNNAGGYFGVEANETSRYELGASLSGYLKKELMKNITMENILNLYSNYLEDPQNVDVDYTMNLVMKVNSFITTNIVFQAIYDDNAVNGFQIREALGVGVTYGF